MAKKETYFRIKVSGETKYYKTTKEVGEHIWVNVDTWNVYMRRPKQIEVPQYRAYKTYPMTRPSEKALNEAQFAV
jgi:hypothetical protein